MQVGGSCPRDNKAYKVRVTKIGGEMERDRQTPGRKEKAPDRSTGRGKPEIGKMPCFINSK